MKCFTPKYCFKSMKALYNESQSVRYNLMMKRSLGLINTWLCRLITHFWNHISRSLGFRSALTRDLKRDFSHKSNSERRGVEDLKVFLSSWELKPQSHSQSFLSAVNLSSLIQLAIITNDLYESENYCPALEVYSLRRASFCCHCWWKLCCLFVFRTSQPYPEPVIFHTAWRVFTLAMDSNNTTVT